MNLSQWFQTQLHSSADGFAWSVEQVPVKALYWGAVAPRVRA